MVLINSALCKSSHVNLLPMSSAPLLKVTDLACQRGDRLLYNDVSFIVAPHQCLHLIGANGTGKSSLLRQIAGLIDTNQVGQTEPVVFQPKPGQGIEHDSFAYLGHSDGLKPELTALENLQFYARYFATSSSLDLDQCLFDVGLLACADLVVKHLSFGQRRRLSLARVLLNDARLWLLDEPLTGVDIKGRTLFMTLFVKHLDAGGAIILTHHQPLDQSSLAPYLHELRLDSEHL